MCRLIKLSPNTTSRPQKLRKWEIESFENDLISGDSYKTYEIVEELNKKIYTPTASIMDKDGRPHEDIDTIK